VRLRSAGAEAREAPVAELQRGVSRLREELAAIAEALEQVSREPQPEASARPGSLLRELAEPPPAPARETGSGSVTAAAGPKRAVK
jgi:hypothetical protein